MSRYPENIGHFIVNAPGAAGPVRCFPNDDNRKKPSRWNTHKVKYSHNPAIIELIEACIQAEKKIYEFPK